VNVLHHKVQNFAKLSYTTNHKEIDSVDVSWNEHTQTNYICVSDSNKM